MTLNLVQFLKKFDKTSKNGYFWAQLVHKKGVSMGHAQNKKQIFVQR